MTAKEKRKLVVSQAAPAMGRNRYSQNGTLREHVFTPYKDGKYYSDCSSFARWMYRKAGIASNIGGNTTGIINNRNLKEIDCGIVKGVPTKISALREGDLLLFRGNNASRSYARYVGHVEMVHSINGNSVTLVGHGSGTPSKKNMVTYCRSRWLWKVANSKIKNRGLICVKRVIQDDVNAPETPTTIIVTGGTVNVRVGAGITNKILGRVKRGAKLALNGNETAKWWGISFNGKAAWISKKYTKVA